MKEQVDACYFCTTPYQILGAISMVEHNKEQADLYIIGQFSSFKEVAEKIFQKKIFRKVITIDEHQVLGLIKQTNSKVVKKVLMFRCYLRIETIISNIIEQQVSYKKMYLTCQSFIIRLVYFYLIKAEPNIEITYFDDGVGSYFDSSLFKINIFDKILRIILFGAKSIKSDFTRVLYIPQLYKSNSRESNDKLLYMPKISISKANIDKINFIFNFKSEDLIKEKVIIFDTLKEEVYGSCGANVLSNYYGIIYSTLSRDNIIIKSHPRSKDINNEDFNYYSNHEIPSEVIYLNMNIEKNILITTASTAVLTPKFIMDKEPIVIMLYKLMDKYHTVDKNLDEFFQSAKQMYMDKDKFYIPKDELELKNILQRIKKQL